MPRPPSPALRPRRAFVLLNVVGGSAVLASYAAGLGAEGGAAALWGGVPVSWRPFYTANMLLAAAGYFPFTGYWLWAADRERVRIVGRYGFGLVLALYAAILFPSALWLPLTAAYLETPQPWLWGLLLLDLALVGAGAMGLLAALLGVEPRTPRLWHRVAVAGSLPFVLQTAVLDAIVWPWLFPR